MQKYGVREICEVVLKAKTAQKIGNKIFYKNEPVLYFDTLKSSSLEGQATAVYAQGGRGNPRLIAWEGERTVTFTMEDALISPRGLAILTGAGLIDATDSKPIQQHIVENTDLVEVSENGGEVHVWLENVPYLPTNHKDNFAYVMFEGLDGELSEPMIPEHGTVTYWHAPADQEDEEFLKKMIALYEKYGIEIKEEAFSEGTDEEKIGKFEIVIKTDTYHIPSQDALIDALGKASGKAYYDEGNGPKYELTKEIQDELYMSEDDAYFFAKSESASSHQLIDHVIVDYYTTRISGAQQIEILANKFGGNYYLEASTLFRNEQGLDEPAEFIIPNCKVQSNFNFTMANSGDPSTFTFTLDAFPDYTRFDKTHKVLCAIQKIKVDSAADLYRDRTNHSAEHDRNFKLY